MKLKATVSHNFKFHILAYKDRVLRLWNGLFTKTHARVHTHTHTHTQSKVYTLQIITLTTRISSMN